MIATANRTMSLNVLLVEDNPNDVFFTMEGFKEAGLPARLTHVENGKECLDYLQRAGAHAETAVRPDLVLLDIDMPLMDGRQVLQAISADDSLRNLPVIVLTTSSREEDIQAMYRLRCNAYLVKPFDFDAFVDLIRSIGSFWFDKASLPTRLPHSEA